MIMIGIFSGIGVGLYFWAGTLTVCQVDPETFESEKYDTPEEAQAVCLESFESTRMITLFVGPLIGGVTTLSVIGTHKTNMRIWNIGERYNWCCVFCGKNLRETDFITSGRDEKIACTRCSKEHWDFE